MEISPMTDRHNSNIEKSQVHHLRFGILFLSDKILVLKKCKHLEINEVYIQKFLYQIGESTVGIFCEF